MQNNQIQLFENRKIRSQWNDDDERWYFSVVDVVAVLTDQENARSASTYWAVLKKRLIAEDADQLLTICKQLKMLATEVIRTNVATALKNILQMPTIG